MSAHDDLRDSSGRPIDREGSTLLGRGGEARVWSLPASGKALKILEPHARTADRLRVLEHLVTTPAPRLQGVDDDLPWGWPEELAFESGACVGYTMRAFRQRRTLFSVLVPTERMRVFPAFDARHIHRVGANLARALACLHDADIVVGDVSESNVLVAPDASVVLVDVDSFQFTTARGELLPCPVGKPELLAPEHHGEFFAATPKTPASDAFSFAVLLFQLLFDGPHPFSGVYRGAGPCPTPAEALLAGDYVFASGGRLTPRLGMPGIEAIHPELAHAFERTFVAGLHRPELRTSVKTWAELLDRAELGLVRCTRNRAHLHPGSAKQCAYCTRSENFGRAFETFANVNSEELPPATKPSVPAAPLAIADNATTAREASVEGGHEPAGAAPRAGHGRLGRWESGKRRSRPLTSRGAQTLPPPVEEHVEAAHAESPAEPITEPQRFEQTVHRSQPDAPSRRAPRVEPPRPPPVSAAAPKASTPKATVVAAPTPRVPRYAVIAALLAAFALGRCSAGSRGARDEAALRESAPLTTPPATRGSAVLRRESPTAEKKTPRTPR